MGEQVWCASLGTRLFKPHCYPVIAGDLYCVATEDGTVVALDLASGQPAWQRSLGEGNIAQALASDGERVLVGCEDVRPIPTPGKAFLALHAGTGEAAWQYPTEAHSMSGAALDGGVLYFTTADGWLHAVEATTGQGQWAVRHPIWGSTPPAAGEGIICAGGRGETLVAYAATDGRELWRFSAGGWFAARPSIAVGRVYALCWDGHLYALDAHTGHPLWKLRGERDKGFTTPPTVAAGSVFVGSRVYREIEGKETGAYAMLALNAEDGGELWRFCTERHILTPPALAERTLFFGTNDGAFYAVDAASGDERWRIRVKSSGSTQPQVSGNVVFFGGRDGMVYAVRWRVSPAEELLAPELYEQQGQHVEAATAHALRGELEAAALIYEEKLDKYQEAALLYERAGQPGKAAPLWARLGELNRARDLYREVGDKPALAEVLHQMGELLRAARLFEEMGHLERAAQLYEQAGDQARAAELYSQLRQFERARPIWESLGSWEKVVKALTLEGKPAEAAQLLEGQGRLERAAALYEEAGQFQRALTIQVKLERWEKVAELALKIGDYQQEAEAREKLGHPRRAAEAYERAAGQLLIPEPVDEERVATLYERAARLYGDILEEECAAACRRQVQRYRHLPEIVVRGEAQEAFVEYEWNTLKLRVENTGCGPACNISIGLWGAFDVEGKSVIEGLSPGQARPLELFVRPHKEHYGPKVPLEIIVAYEDSRGHRYEVTQRLPVRVIQRGISPGAITPLEIQIQGDLIQPGVKVESPTAAIRDLLTDAFSDEELTALCFDHFRSVFEEFSSGMSKRDKIQRLVEHCARQRALDDLLALVRERNPGQFAHFEAQLHVPVGTSADPKAREGRI